MKMTRCRLEGGNGEVGMARWRLENRKRLPSWKMLGGRERLAAWVEEGEGEGKAAGDGWRRLVQGEAVKLKEAVDGKVKMVRWRWQGGRNHRILCEEWRHPGCVKIYGKTMFLLIGPDTPFIWKGSVFPNKIGHYIY